MTTPRDIFAALLVWLVQLISGFCLVCYIAGHPEWTSWIAGAQMALPTAICFSALAFALYLQRPPK